MLDAGFNKYFSIQSLSFTIYPICNQSSTTINPSLYVKLQPIYKSHIKDQQESHLDLSLFLCFFVYLYIGLDFFFLFFFVNHENSMPIVALSLRVPIPITNIIISFEESILWIESLILTKIKICGSYVHGFHFVRKTF